VPDVGSSASHAAQTAFDFLAASPSCPALLSFALRVETGPGTEATYPQRSRDADRRSRLQQVGASTQLRRRLLAAEAEWTHPRPDLRERIGLAARGAGLSLLDGDHPLTLGVELLDLLVDRLDGLVSRAEEERVLPPDRLGEVGDDGRVRVLNPLGQLGAGAAVAEGDRDLLARMRNQPVIAVMRRA
jgi:hypothetical protein